jgi:hypothetical protein
VPDRHTVPNRPTGASSGIARRPARRLRHLTAFAACVAVGFSAGAATAEVWDVPRGTPDPVHAVPVTPGREAPPERDDTVAASRSGVERAVREGEAPGLVDLVSPRPLPLVAPTPSPTPSPTATATATPEPAEVLAAPEAPVPEPGSGLVGDVTVVPDLGGTLVTVPGEAPAPGTGTVRSVRVDVEAGLPVDGETFATAVLATLNDPRGWSGPDGVTFSRTAADDASIRVVLASPATTDRLCAPLATEGKYSCGNSVAGVAVLNFERWVVGAPDFGDDVATYRQYLVSHEVGHVLGHGHEACPAPGAVAPVMVQQTISAEGCVPNGWPVP